MTAVLVKAMADFMTGNSTKSPKIPIIEIFWTLSAKGNKWKTKETGWEHDLRGY